jgi:hypothetical protein
MIACSILIHSTQLLVAQNMRMAPEKQSQKVFYPHEDHWQPFPNRLVLLLGIHATEIF